MALAYRLWCHIGTMTSHTGYKHRLGSMGLGCVILWSICCYSLWLPASAADQYHLGCYAVMFLSYDNLITLLSMTVIVTLYCSITAFESIWNCFINRTALYGYQKVCFHLILLVKSLHFYYQFTTVMLLHYSFISPNILNAKLNFLTSSRSTPLTTRTTFYQNLEPKGNEPISSLIANQTSHRINVCDIVCV